ncbi:glutathione synthetase-like [Gadus chalcogrammus]|uniref:glutathione synthetase-like n=1 Tax=Gadus chalcogrammus TaxID=1042646 RepID=UPI0024C268F8|nr:glutathione synthetase-like [Gadus chalcogrammus]
MKAYRTLYELMDNPEKLQVLAKEAKVFCLLNGLPYPMKESPELVTYAPVTLFPTPVRGAVFEQALAVQPHYNLLVDRISQDAAFLEEALSSTVLADDFTARLFNIHKQMLSEGRASPIVLGINRSDYMLDESEVKGGLLKLVEINTFAAGAFGTSDTIAPLHRHVLRLAGLEGLRSSVPDSNSTVRLACALQRAWELYARPQAAILFLVDDVEMIFFSHFKLINELRERGISSIRNNFEFVHKTGRLSSDDRLFVDGWEVAVVFFRDGYVPGHYTEESWATRLLMERSRAIKCPDIATHLAGTKKVQQVLARPGVLERFFPEQPQVVQQIRATFVGSYTLDQCPEGDRAAAMAMDSPDRYVLKPQREGGGHNFFDADLVRVLEEEGAGRGRASYVLMERLRPRVERNVLLRRDTPPEPCDVVGELGVFGAYIRAEGEMVLNVVAGHVMRTKPAEHRQGGVNQGLAVFDNLILC